MRMLPGKYSVHSPFVFNLITKVIEERNPFYRFEEIELIRKRLLQDNRPVTRHDPRGKGKQTETTVSGIVRREAVTAKKGALLFRLANHFKPKTMLLAGSSTGLSTLYLTSYAAGLKCVSFEPLREFAAISQWVYGEAARTSIEQHTGEVNSGQLTECLNTMKTLDLVFFNSRDEQIDVLQLFNACLPYSTDHTLFIIDGINKTKRTRAVWNELTGRQEVTVSIDLRTSGLVFLNGKLHKRNYKIHF